MKLTLKTKVQENYKIVYSKFDRRLFEALAPKQAKIEIVEFTGSKKGDQVHVRFLSPLKTEWVSVITEDEINAREAYFTDEGVQLPFPLKFWKHKHLIEKISETESYIVDDITYRCSNVLLDLLMYPIMLFGFFPRKKIYRKFFDRSA